MASTDFKEVFPGLETSDRLSKLLDHVIVDRVTINDSRNSLHVYIEASNWIGKQYIYETEKAIKEQFFAGTPMTVTVVERFRLSASYRPDNFYDIYRTSMLIELKKTSPLLYQLFSHASLSFPSENEIRAVLPDTIVTHSRKEEFLHYLDKVFHDRAGFDTTLSLSIEGNEADVLFARDEAAISDRVDAVIARNASRKAKQEGPDKKLPAKKTAAPKAARHFTPNDPSLIFGRDFEGEPVPIESLGDDPHEVIIRGEVFAVTSQETRSGRVIFSVSVTDHTDSIRLKFWLDKEELPEYEEAFRKGKTFLIRGMMDFDPYDKEMIIRQVWAVKKAEPLRESREDNAPVKRVELHCHTKMSDMDAVSSATDIIRKAYDWGHKALAITDHGVVQAFPEALHAFGGKGGIPKDADMKILYGCEAYLVDDTVSLVARADGRPVSQPVVVFSTVTTGRSPYDHQIIEIAGVRFENGQVTSSFKSLVDPGRPIPFSIAETVGINDDMVAGAPSVKQALGDFFEFAGDSALVAYDADYEMSFIRQALEESGGSRASDGASRASDGESGISGGGSRASADEGSSSGDAAGPLNALQEKVNSAVYIDVPSVLRYLMPDIGKIRFDSILKKLKIPCSDQMRAYPRAKALAMIWQRLLEICEKEDIRTLKELNRKGRVDVQRIRNLPYYHAIILIQNETGRRNLYKLVSESHLNYFKRRPRMPRSLMSEYREGLIFGSACAAGELYKAIRENKSDAEIAQIVDFYDYLEIQPTGNNQFLIEESGSGINSVEDLRDINRRIVKLGEQFHKPVCATCDVHFLNPEDEIYRRIIQAGHGYEDVTQPPLYLRTTEEMLEEFSYLGEEKAYEVVVTNTIKIADRIEKISPIHPDKCPPTIPHSEEDLQEMCYKKAHRMYGDPLPEIVETRLKKELDSICKNGYSVMYIIAQKLVAKSLSDGYLVGSRGSVGSSFVATMADITEVNPLPPHYYCPSCHFTDFDSDEVKAYRGRAGCDMPDRLCPNCGKPLKKDGFDIPFETFLGFKGDKEPDIDLNFSGDEQGIAQAYTETIFGKGQTFKAGTIGTVADKTAYGYAMHYFEDRGVVKRSCELERLSEGCVGVRRTTGQHPGGVIVVPKGMDINWFTPVQHPANDMTSDIITTHFDYHSIDRNLLKLDILGHDDPTMIRMLQDLTGEDPLVVPLDDKGVLSLFSSTDALGVTPDEIGGVDMGTLGVPEFGTDFVMGMLRDTRPSTFSELVRISGLSHGTDVWLGNAQEYIRSGDATLSTAICTRDDIMLNLIAWGVEASHAFTIMEAVRKGKGLKPDQESEMREHGVPEWYIESCKKIKYMFPKAHAAAYVMNAFRIAYYKINYPLAYYAAMFSIRVTTFDYAIMAQGREHMEEEVQKIAAKSELSPKEEELLKDVKIVREMYARGFEFLPLDLYQAKAKQFRIMDGKLMPAINSVAGLGDTQAEAVEAEAKKGRFLSKDDFRTRTKVSKTIIDALESLGVLSDMPETNQISLFDVV